MDKRSVLRLGTGMLAGSLLPAHTLVRAQGYPDRPIRIIVPYTPGGFNDTLARTLAQKLQEAWSQPAVVENKPGGATVIGIEAAAKSAPDGYTLVILPFSFAVNPSIFKKLPYDASSFAPITLAASTANMLVANNSFPANNVKELIALARAKPGSISYASTGIGSSNHLSMEKFKQMAKVDLAHVAYKGSVPAVTDLIGGHVQVMFDNISNVIEHVRAGRIKALAVTTSERSVHTPGLPTVSESGVPGYEVGVWFGVAAPAGTPAPIVEKLHGKIVEILRQGDVKAKFAAQGVDVVASTPAQFAAHVRDQQAKWAVVVREAGITPE